MGPGAEPQRAAPCLLYLLPWLSKLLKNKLLPFISFVTFMKKEVLEVFQLPLSSTSGSLLLFWVNSSKELSFYLSSYYKAPGPRTQIKPSTISRIRGSYSSQMHRSTAGKAGCRGREEQLLINRQDISVVERSPSQQYAAQHCACRGQHGIVPLPGC